MTALRLRIFILMLFIGLAPLTLLAFGLRYLPGGLLPWLWYGLLAAGVVVMSVALCGSVARPVREAIQAIRSLLTSASLPKPKTWVPAEYWAMRDSLTLLLRQQREERARIEQRLADNLRSLHDAENAAMRSITVLHAVAEATAEAVVFMHNSGHLALANQKAREMFSLSDEYMEHGIAASLWLGKVAEQFEDGDVVNKIWEHWQAGAPGDQEGEWNTRADESRCISVRCIEVRGADGLLLGRVWMFRDCTDERRVHVRLLESQKLEAMGQMAGGIAHDFNNLLTAIRGNLNLAELETDPGRKSDKLEGATRAATRAAELVNQILGYSRKSSPRKQLVDLPAIIADVHNMLRASIDPKVSLHIHAAKDTWQVNVEPVNIEQVVLNMALNARDALPESGGSIDISTANLTLIEARRDKGESHAPGDYVVIKIKDNGCGIPTHVRERMFEAFYTSKAPGKGTGLGLATARSMVTQAGGWIEFDSEIGKGTEFRIFLPRSSTAKAPASAKPAVEAPRAPARSVVTRGSADGTILVVDDEAPVRSIAVNMLKYLGYRVIEASDGEEAIRILRNAEKPIDAMIMDMYMPKLSGRDTFKQIRQLGIEVPVIVCSGFMVEPDEFISLIQGRNSVVEVIQKPYSMEALARIVAKAVDKGCSALAA